MKNLGFWQVSRAPDQPLTFLVWSISEGVLNSTLCLLEEAQACMCMAAAVCPHSSRQARFTLLRGRVDAQVRGCETLARDQPEDQSQGSLYSLCAWASPPEKKKKKKLSFSSVGSSQFFILDLTVFFWDKMFYFTLVWHHQCSNGCRSLGNQT